VLYCTGLNASHYQQWLLDDSTTVTRHIPISSAALVFPTCHLTDANHQHNKQNKQIATNKSTCLNHIYYAEYKSRRIVYLQALYNSNSPTQTTTSGRDRPSQYVTIIIRMWQTDSVAETVAMNAAEKLVYRMTKKMKPLCSIAQIFKMPNWCVWLLANFTSISFQNSDLFKCTSNLRFLLLLTEILQVNSANDPKTQTN